MIKIWEYIYHTSNHSNFHLPYNHAQLMQIYCVVFCLVCRQIILLRLSKLDRDHLVCIGKRSHANNVVKADCQHVGCINISCLNLNAIKRESCNEYVCRYVSLIKKNRTRMSGMCQFNCHRSKKIIAAHDWMVRERGRDGEII